MNVKQMHLLAEWEKAQEALTIAKAQEMALRKQVEEEWATDAKVGTTTIPLEQGFVLKIVKKINMSLDKAALPDVLKRLPEGLEDHLINYDPKLKAAGYKSLDIKSKKIFDTVVITKPGAPTISIVPPKEKK